jgi:NAD(P)-dependent dehydrogenase (short-subunit alcohol dehydrogenase family)
MARNLDGTLDGKLDGKRILITGVSRGIGRATARLFLAEGADVVGVARDEQRLAAITDELSARFPGRFEPVALDVTAPDAGARVAGRVSERWQALDLLVNNAAVMTEGPPSLEAEPGGTLEATFAVNLFAPFHLALALLPQLRRGREPRIIHVTSGAGTQSGLAEGGIASYRLSKWALNGLIRIQARELAGEIAVNGLDPGWVKTDLGGPRAPGVPEESAAGALALALEPFTTTGKLFKDGAEIAY